MYGWGCFSSKNCSLFITSWKPGLKNQTWDPTRSWPSLSRLAKSHGTSQLQLHGTRPSCMAESHGTQPSRIRTRTSQLRLSQVTWFESESHATQLYMCRVRVNSDDFLNHAWKRPFIGQSCQQSAYHFWSKLTIIWILTLLNELLPFHELQTAVIISYGKVPQ